MTQLTIDVGGTFTDCLVLDDAGQLQRFKASTTPDDPTDGFFAAVAKAAAHYGQSLERFLGEVEQIVHGTTLGTNILITGRGAKVGMITTKNFRDVLEMRRGIRNLHGSMFDMFIAPYEPLVPRDLRLGIEERTLYTGESLTPLNEDELRAAVRRLLDENCTAIAVCFLHSYANGESELKAKRIVQQMAPAVYVTTSHEILPVWREFERFSTAVISAYIGPAVTRYAGKLQRGLRERGFRGRLLMMLANGLVQVVDECMDRAVYLLNSGPAAAPSAAAYLGGLHDRKNLLSMDMGGTSFDICVVRDGEIPTTTDSWVGEHRVAIKMVDVPTVGAGGGSLAWIDTLGLLRVGPQSAGADPGPAAYGRGNEATVTDADLVLGYIPADYFLGGDIKLDVERSHAAVARIGSRVGLNEDQTAQVMFTTINNVMANLVTEACTKKGHDVRDFTLVAGGGAGGVHAAAIAKQLGIPMVIVPRVAALMSAFGMFVMDLGLEYARSCARRQNQLDFAEINALYADMRRRAKEDFGRIGIPESQLSYRRTVEMRYVGQFHEVEIDLPEGELSTESLQLLLRNFHAKYEKLYTYSMTWRATEFLTFHLKVTAPPRPVQLVAGAASGSNIEAARRGFRSCLFEGSTQREDTPIYDWDRLEPGHRIAGPALIDDRTTTVLVPRGFGGAVDRYGNLLLTADKAARLHPEPALEGEASCRGLKLTSV
ncbi:MAG: hydantoinase/oxoprolinase family protein [Hyphomicrobiales bacterium]|nr:hydantoinase/oxoprolinase family protein [Hyphomicrobiales bacterium]